MKIDLPEFARLGQTASGALPLVAATRIDTPARDGSLAWTATGAPRGRHGAQRLDLAIDGTVTLICQRCLQPMQQVLSLRPSFLVVPDEETADALDDDDDFDTLVAEREFDVDALVEDEVILALPSAPRHAVCPTADPALEQASTRPSPFAALAALRDGGLKAPNPKAD